MRLHAMEVAMPPKPTKKTVNRSVLPEDDDAYVRLPDVLRVYPVSETTWWEGVAAGRFPRPTKLSTRVSAWQVRQIRALLQARAEEVQSKR